MNKKKRGKKVKYISVSLDIFQKEPLIGITHKLGSAMATTYLVLCLRIIDKGDYAAELTFADKEAISKTLGVHMEKLDKQLELLIDEGYFIQVLFNEKNLLTNPFIQTKFLCASYHSRKSTTAIPLEILCVPSTVRMAYRVGLSEHNSKEVIQYMSDRAYLAVCQKFGGVDKMNSDITKAAQLLR